MSEDNEITYLSTEDPDFFILDDVSVGDMRKDIIELYGDNYYIDRDMGMEDSINYVDRKSGIHLQFYYLDDVVVRIVVGKI